MSLPPKLHPELPLQGLQKTPHSIQSLEQLSLQRATPPPTPQTIVSQSDTSSIALTEKSTPQSSRYASRVDELEREIDIMVRAKLYLL